MNQVKIFNFNESQVRLLIDNQGNPWWIAAEVCMILNLSNPTEAIRNLDEDEKSTLRVTEGGPERNIISESGLYSLILRSNKPEAKKFKRWITHEVIPSIRKTGHYGTADPIEVFNDPAAMRGLLLTYTEKVLALESTVKEQAPKVEALDRLSTSDGSLCITDAAKALQLRPKDLFQWLAAHDWIYRRAGGNHWIAYQARLKRGALEHKVTTVSRNDGSEKVGEQVRVTPRGLAELAKAFSVETAAA